MDEGGIFAEVVFDRPLDHPFTYRVPAALQANLALGKRLKVPFGKGDRTTVGFCVGITDSRPDRAVKNVLEIIDNTSLFTQHMMRLTRWMADYYLCGWGQVLNSVVPAGVKSNAGTREFSMILPVVIERRPDPFPSLTVKQKLAWDFLSQCEQSIELKQLLQLAGCSQSVIEGLIKKGLAEKHQQRLDNTNLQQGSGLAGIDLQEQSEALTLNVDQAKVFQKIEQAFVEGGFQPMLLHGVTGSGKTEVYLRAIEKVMAEGKQVIVLVPEISLTPQTIQRFQGRCGQIAVLHSHLRDAERGSYWRKIADGEVQVVVGARSAIFAPTKQLGMIIIDEEHEASFKQETTPRYHARDVAVMRARLENIPILLGSATPSMESWHNAERGQYQLLTLPTRVRERPLPKVGIIDMRHDVPRGNYFQGLSPSLEHAMRRELSNNGQVILLLNRRGFSTHVHCVACGYVDTCRFCDLAMTYHQHRDVNLCHHCGYEQEPPQLCPQCSQVRLRYQGLGTEKLEAEIEQKFSGYVVRRMDSDTMRRPGSHGSLLKAFRNGEVDILMGTQMIAKGLDFPNVTLVGVINADVGLNRPDFRASERTFQILAQVAGRAGRGDKAGMVLIQTFNPEHPAITFAAHHDYLNFVRVEAQHRRDHGYPPYQRMARVIIRGQKEDEVQQFADHLGTVLQQAKGSIQPLANQKNDLRILGPAEAPVYRLKGFYRFHLQIHSASSGLLHQLLRPIVQSMRVPGSVEFTVDVDPWNMM